METLFDIFCRCAELNPEPNEGEYQNPGLDMSSICFGGSTTVICIAIYSLCVMLLAEGEDEHNWIFSADQMEDEASGTILTN